MAFAYEKIVKDNLHKLYGQPTVDLEGNLPAVRKDNIFFFQAFGQACQLSPDEIQLGNSPQEGVVGILISLYALNVTHDTCLLEPLKAYKDFPNSMPYVGAFASHTERILIPYIDVIEKNMDLIFEKFNGELSTGCHGADLSFVVRPFPKIKLNYIFYRADDEFPASVTCLFSNNALSFLPMDGLADTGEYTSKKIIEFVS